MVDEGPSQWDDTEIPILNYTASSEFQYDFFPSPEQRETKERMLRKYEERKRWAEVEELKAKEEAKELLRKEELEKLKAEIDKLPPFQLTDWEKI